MNTRICLLAVILCACGADEETPPPEQPQGRAETQSIRNTEAVGYSGNAIADKVDATLKANDQRVQETDKAAEE